jgi:hypothetical protein
MSNEPRKRGNPNWQPGGSEHRPASGIPVGGDGWGGPARGSAAHFSADNQPNGDMKSAGKASKVAMVAYLVAKQMRAAEKIVALIDDPEAAPQVQLAASIALLNRLHGTPAASLALTGGDEQPHVVTYRWEGDEELMPRN